MHREPVLSFEGAGLRERGLAPLDLQLQAGEVVRVSADTSAADAIRDLACGRQLPGQGEVRVAGLPPTCWPPADLARLVHMMRPLARRVAGTGCDERTAFRIPAEPAVLNRVIAAVDERQLGDQITRLALIRLLLPLHALPAGVCCLILDNRCMDFPSCAQPHVDALLQTFAANRQLGILLIDHKTRAFTALPAMDRNRHMAPLAVR